MFTKAYGSAETIIDLKRYPVLELDTPHGRDFLSTCQAQLASSGCCALTGFIKNEAVEWMRAEAGLLAPLAYRSTVKGNAYLEPEDHSLNLNHPKRRVDTTSLGAVAYDQIPGEALIRKLYEWAPLVKLLERILQVPKLYRYNDSLSGLNIAVMEDGDYLRWHFDQTDFVTSLALQDAEGGGDFEFVPMIRTAKQENFERVAALLDGSREGVVHLEMQPGTLILFEGRNSIHRVTTIRGRTPRLVALLGYDTRPDVKGTEHLQFMRYGRVASPAVPGVPEQ